MNLSVSVIMPVYNTESFLDESISSILNQGLKKYEIIIVNDGSNDQSLNIIKKYAKDYPFITYISQKNKGQGAARNRALNIAKGEYIYFMDSDDVLKPNSLYKLYNRAVKFGLDTIFFDGKSFNEIKNMRENITSTNYHRKKSYGLFLAGEDLMASLIKGYDFLVSPCLYLIKRDIILNNSIQFVEGIKHEDEIFTTQVFLYTNKCEHINEVFFLRRIRENSTMTNKDKTISIKSYVKVLEIMNNLYKEFEFKNKKTKKIFNKRLEQVYKSVIAVYNQNANKTNVSDSYDKVISIARENHHFSLTAFFYTYISKSVILSDLYNKTTGLIKLLKKV